ncbi:MAG: putative addiction module antidote protein [Actinomycetaceae bacterium]|nr:putative addiction module antidote protein [Arcanobacterium sp.]MDD7687634.1 putative addiction module antidote protein [Actinomycetaceae bacterium]MDY5273127.1 addiction module antidote protein [Arcanobacterium sp.]
MTIKTKIFDPAQYIETPEDVADYLSIALEDGDPATLQMVLGDIARSEGMSKLARETGLNRESLYKSLSAQGNPTMDTIFKVTKALGLRLSLVPANSAPSANTELKETQAA